MLLEKAPQKCSPKRLLQKAPLKCSPKRLLQKAPLKGSPKRLPKNRLSFTKRLLKTHPKQDLKLLWPEIVKY